MTEKEFTPRHGERVALISGPRDLLVENRSWYESLEHLCQMFKIESPITLLKGETVETSRVRELQERDNLGDSSILFADFLIKESVEVYEDIMTWLDYDKPLVIMGRENLTEEYLVERSIVERRVSQKLQALASKDDLALYQKIYRLHFAIRPDTNYDRRSMEGDILVTITRTVNDLLKGLRENTAHP